MTKPKATKAKKKTEEPVEKFNLQQHVTNQILEALETGVKPWQRAWKNKGTDFSSGIGPIPMNLSSKKHYRGINILLLWTACKEAQAWRSEPGLAVAVLDFKTGRYHQVSYEKNVYGDFRVIDESVDPIPLREDVYFPSARDYII